MTTINWGLLGGVYAMLHAVHGIADYWLQTDWQAKNKSSNWKALGMHLLSYGTSFWAVSIALHFWASVPVWKCVALPFVVALPHGWMDRRKFLGWFLLKTKGWKPEDMAMLSAPAVAIRTHVAIHMDQKFHTFCLMLTAVWLASN